MLPLEPSPSTALDLWRKRSTSRRTVDRALQALGLEDAQLDNIRTSGEPARLLKAHLRGLLSQPFAGRRSAVEAFLESRRHATDAAVSDVGRALIEAGGAHLADLHLLAVAVGDWIQMSRGEEGVIGAAVDDTPEVPALLTWIRMSPDLVWHTSETGDWLEYGKDLPDTVASALTGRPLRHLVSHPVLDRFDLAIHDISRRDTLRIAIERKRP